METSLKITEIKKLVGSMDLFELHEFVTLFHIPLSLASLVQVASPTQWTLYFIKTPKMIQTVKVIRVVTGWGLKDAKAWWDVNMANVPDATEVAFITNATAEQIDAFSTSCAEASIPGFCTKD